MNKLSNLMQDIWEKAIFSTSLRWKLMLPTLGLTLIVISLLTWFASNIVQTTVNNIYTEKARAVASLVSKAIIDQEYILYYSEKLDQDIAQLVQLYPDVFRITIYGKVRDTVRVITSSDPTRVGLETPVDEIPSLFTKTASTRLKQEGSRSLYEVGYPLYQKTEIIGLVVVDLSLVERDQFLQEVYANFFLGGIISFLTLGGLLYLALRGTVSKPIYKLAKASEKIAAGDYTFQVDSGLTSEKLTVRDEIQRLIGTFNHMIRMIKHKEERLEAMIVEDQLTGVYNRQHFDKLARIEIERASRYQNLVSFLLVDILKLDQINLKYGQEEGDRVLRQVASLLVSTFRQVDEVFRYGGDEFIVIMPETDEEGTKIGSERLLQGLGSLNKGATVAISLNTGFTTWHSDPEVGWKVNESEELTKILAEVSSMIKSAKRTNE